MQVNIQQKVILFTGASKGFGAKLAYRLSQERAYVIINYNNSKLHA